jgi:hypothetical protein
MTANAILRGHGSDDGSDGIYDDDDEDGEDADSDDDFYELGVTSGSKLVDKLVYKYMYHFLNDIYIIIYVCI